MEPSILKICSICEKEKGIENFWKCNSAKDKLFSSCKDCNSKVKKEYYIQNKKQLNDYGKKYYRQVISIDSVRQICYNTLYQHKRKGYKIDITIEELINMANATDYCIFCNKKLDKTLGNKGTCHKNSLSFDCINKEKEFIRGNIRVICNYCNTKGKRRKRKNKNIRNVDLCFRKINNLVTILLSQKQTLSHDQIRLLEKYLKNSQKIVIQREIDLNNFKENTPVDNRLN